MSYEVEMFHDGDCALCAREVRMLRRLDAGRGKIRFTDIAAPGFDATAYGMTQDQFMARIKARKADGTWLDGVDVFRALYSVVGFDLAVRASRLPGISGLLDVGYDLFAKNRLRLTGRSDACSSEACDFEPT